MKVRLRVGIDFQEALRLIETDSKQVREGDVKKIVANRHCP